MHSKALETGLSDFHKMVCTFMRNTYSRQEPVKIIYRGYKGFEKKNSQKTTRNQDLRILLIAYLMQIMSMINKSLYYGKF